MKNEGKVWSKEDIGLLKDLASKNVDSHKIAEQLGRSLDSTYNKASELKITLNPKDKPNVK